MAVGGIVIQRKQYGAWDFGAAAVMAVGLVWFTLADSTVSPVFDVTGVVMISLALLADAVIGNVQEKAMKTHHAANCEVDKISDDPSVRSLFSARCRKIRFLDIYSSVLPSFPWPGHLFQ